MIINPAPDDDSRNIAKMHVIISLDSDSFLQECAKKWVLRLSTTHSL